MIDRLETCRVYRATIPLSFLQIIDPYTVPTRFYESLNEKNRMCKLFPNPCMYSIIRCMANTHLLRISYSGKFLMGVIFKFQKSLKSQVIFKGAFSLSHCTVSVCSLVMGLC